MSAPERAGEADIPNLGSPAATPIPVVESELAAIAYDSQGLVPAVVQDYRSGRVLMMAWMDASALRRTLETGRTWFWSRSRRTYWQKGETSGDRQWVRRAYYDCDGDCLLFEVEQEGLGACHTRNESCFYRGFGGNGEDRAAVAGPAEP